MAQDQYNTIGPRLPTAHEQEIIAESLREFSQLTMMRSTFGTQWDEVAQLIDPNSRNTFQYGDFNWQGMKKTDRQIDATGMASLGKFSAICDSLSTPRNMIWHTLAANDDYLNGKREIRLWFEQVNRILFKYRYSPHANFASQNQMNFRNLGAYGNAGMFIDEFDGTQFGQVRGIRYMSMPLGELFFHENHQKVVDGVCRWFRLTARQAYQKWGDRIPETLKVPLEQNSEMLFNFLHRICPRTDYDPGRLDDKGKPWASYYISLEGRTLLSEGGYRSFPMAISRYEQAAGETYGRSPAMSVLPSLKTLNAQKVTFLKQGHRAADPVLLTGDDGIIDFSLRPGALNKGGVNADGRPMVHVLPAGQIQISKEMMAEEKAIIQDAFLVTLFQILTETPQMTATEVIERTNEKGILLAPTVGRQQSEYLGPMIARELTILAEQRLLPPMPPLLREAGGEYEVTYTSPLARAMRAQEASGFFRSVEMVKELVAVTQDPSLLDGFDFDTAIPVIAMDINGVPPSWMASDQQISLKRQNRAKAQARQEQIQAAPAAAAMMKAQAVAAKAGGGVQLTQNNALGGPLVR